VKETATTQEKTLQQLREAYALLRKEHNLSYEDILQQLQQIETTIPSSVFTRQLSGLETITKYLKENQRLELKEIARRLNRTYRTVWGAYHASQQKYPALLTASPTPHHLPLSIFSERKLSVLETITHYLRAQHKLRYSQIAKILHRDPRTIWVTEHNAQGKLK